MALVGMFTVIHPTAEIGDGTKIWHFCNIMADAMIGENCTIGAYTEIGKSVKIGYGCKIQAHCFIPEGIDIGDEVFIGPGVRFTNVRYPSATKKGQREIKTLVFKGATIGANCTILPGVMIGCGAMVGAGMIVTRDVPAGETVYETNPHRRMPT